MAARETCAQEMASDRVRGSRFPLGATVLREGVNFSVFSKNGEAVELLLFDSPDSPEPARTLRLDPRTNRTYHYWHVFVPDIGPGQVYAYRVHGPHAPERGLRFDAGKVLLDPYGRAVAVPAAYSREAARRPGDNCAVAMRSVVADARGYDWEGDRPLRHTFSRTVIYEMHLRGFTAHPNSGVALISSLADSTYELVSSVRNNTLQVPAPSPKAADWPIVGKKVHSYWSQLHEDLPAVVQKLQPQIGVLAKHSLDIVAGTGGKILQFLFSFIIAGVIMSFGESGARAAQAIFERIVGTDRGKGFADLSTATIRTVAAGVIGIACIQALITGLALLIAGIPWAGILALVTLVFGIAQLPAFLVNLPVIGYIWWSGDYSTVAAISYSALLVVAGTADNILKPFMLGRGVDAPMPVILLGALGGMATTGILGMFLGATLLALGYQIFMWWVANNPDSQPEESGPKTAA